MSESSKVQEIITELLADKAKFWKTPEIESLLNRYVIYEDELLLIIEKLAEDYYIFKWLDFISLKLEHVANQKNFLHLLKIIITKVKGDTAQGAFIGSLIGIGEHNEILGLDLYKRMIASGDLDLIYYSSFPIGGSGKTNYQNAFSVISKGLDSCEPEIKAASIRSLRVIFENKSELTDSTTILVLLNKLSSNEQALSVQLEVLAAYFDFTSFQNAYKDCIAHLNDYAEKGNSNIRFKIADLLWIRNLRVPEDTAHLLAICALDENINVLSRVATALSQKGKDFPECSLGIIKKWILNGKYVSINEIDYCVEMIGKAQLSRCVAEIEKWLNDDLDTERKLSYYSPILLDKLSTNNYTELLNIIKDWPLRSERFWWVTLQTIKKVLTSTSSSYGTFVETSLETLKSMSKIKGLNVPEVVGDETDKLYQCFRIIEALQCKKVTPNFDNILAVFESYSGIRDFFGIDWFSKMKEENNNSHPLLGLLSNSLVKEETVTKQIKLIREESDPLNREIRTTSLLNTLRPKAFLEYFDKTIKDVLQKNSAMSNLKRGLRNRDQFWETVSEIEVISALSKYNAKIAPKIGRKELDVCIEIEGEVVYFEVINPNMFKPLKYMTEKAFGIPNRVKGKIYQEFKSNLENLEQFTTGKEFVIIIDIGRSEIDYDFVEDYLFGTLQLSMQIDNATGKVMETHPSRAKDSMHELKEKMDVLSAVICYKANIGRDLKFHREGKLILNPTAMCPMSERATRAVEESLFT